MRLIEMNHARERGHAMLELALSASVMMACLAGTFQFGYTFYIYDQLVSTVGNGARYAASRTYRSASAADIEKGRAAIRNLVVYGDSRPAADAVPLTRGLKPENVQVAWVMDETGKPSAVDLTIVNYSVGAIFAQFKIDHRPFAEFPYIGRYAPSESEP